MTRPVVSLHIVQATALLPSPRALSRAPPARPQKELTHPRLLTQPRMSEEPSETRGLWDYSPADVLLVDVQTQQGGKGYLDGRSHTGVYLHQ